MGDTSWGNSVLNGRSSGVAAAPAATALPFGLETGDPPNPTGPFPNPFTKTQKPEHFTSDGPRRVFFTAAGTPIAPGNLSKTGGASNLTFSIDGATCSADIGATTVGIDHTFVSDLVGTLTSPSHYRPRPVRYVNLDLRPRSGDPRRIEAQVGQSATE